MDREEQVLFALILMRCQSSNMVDTLTLVTLIDTALLLFPLRVIIFIWSDHV